MEPLRRVDDRLQRERQPTPAVENVAPHLLRYGLRGRPGAPTGRPCRAASAPRTAGIACTVPHLFPSGRPLAVLGLSVYTGEDPNISPQTVWMVPNHTIISSLADPAIQS
eukprot:EG_transcript_17099